MKLEFRRIALIVALLALVAGLAAGHVLAQTQNPPGRPGPRGMMMGQRGPGGPGPGGLMLGRLNLTDEQKTQVQKIHEQAFQGQQDARKQMADLQKQLRDAIFADSPDEAAIGSLQQQISQLESQFLSHRVGVEKQISKILTAEQRKQLRETQPAGRGFGRGRGRGLGFGAGMGMGRGFDCPNW